MDQIGQTNLSVSPYLYLLSCTECSPQNDLITWLIEGARDANEEVTVPDMASRVLFTSFGAIHTTSIVSSTLYYATFHLYLYIQMIGPRIRPLSALHPAGGCCTAERGSRARCFRGMVQGYSE